MAGHHAVARDLLVGHAEVTAAVLDEHVPLLEGAFVEQDIEALARGQLALAVLGLDPLFPAAGARRRALLLEPPEDFLHARPQIVANQPAQADSTGRAATPGTPLTPGPGFNT